jgi:hypothetical protein
MVRDKKGLKLFMKKIIVFILCLPVYQIDCISTVMNHRTITSSPLLYKQIDYTHDNVSIEFEPWISQSFDPDRIIANLSLNQKSTVTLNQQGKGDINPAWFFLQSTDQNENYSSTVTFNPSQQIYGLLFHTYKQWHHLFVDLKTSLLNCKNKIEIQEFGTGHGGLASNTNQIIYNAYDAFTQNAFEYGKIGQPENLIGFDNIQLMFGASGMVSRMQSNNCSTYCAGFGLLEVPTGQGTTAQWLFEPQVGTNNWAFGFGADLMFATHYDVSLVVGGNFRHLIANWQTRTFDMQQNGAWSRYLLLDDMKTLDLQPNLGIPAINFVTQNALLSGRNQINLYARCQKNFTTGLLEVSYNLLYNQAERIRHITPIPSCYGIYALGTTGGITTASTATIDQAYTVADNLLNPVQLVTSQLYLNSGVQGQWLSNMVAVRLQKVKDFYTYGIGGSVDLGRGSQAISSWSAWANFEFLLG